MKAEPAEQFQDGLHYGGRLDEAECRRLVALGIARGWITPPGLPRWVMPPRNKLLKVLMHNEGPHPQPLPHRMGEGGRRPGEGYPE